MRGSGGALLLCFGRSRRTGEFLPAAPSSAAAAERAARQIGLSSHPARSAIISPASPPPSPRHRRSPMLRARSDAAALEAAAVKDTAEQLLTVCPLIWTLRRHARVAGCSLPHGARSPGPWPAGCAQERGLHCLCWQHWPDRCGPGGGPALVHVECAPHWSVPCQALPPPSRPVLLASVSHKLPSTMTPQWEAATAKYRAMQLQDPIREGGY